MEKIGGIVEQLIFASDDSRFCVFRLKSTAGNVTAVYRGKAPFSGEQIEAEGEWVEHPRFGKQFGINTYRAVQPTGTDAIEKFLASGAIKGVGPAMAARIVDAFGKKTFEIIENEPYRLREVSGIGKKKAADIINSFSERSRSRDLIMFLESNGLSSSYADRIALRYGETAINRIKADPYCLVDDIDGIGFKIADRLAVSLGIEAENPARIRAGIGYTLNMAVNGGHTCIPERALLSAAERVLQVDFIEVERVFSRLVEMNQIRTVDFGGELLVYPEYLYRAEVNTARSLLALRDAAGSLGMVNTEKIIAEWEKEAGIVLAEAQKEAIRSSLHYGVFALTGGPGTGKTTIIKGMVSVLKKAGCKVLLAAPTGRAARRLQEASGSKALTVHRLLEYGVDGEFGKNEEEQLEGDAIIIDEASMMDIWLTSHLLDAVKPGSRLIFVGDVDQLPSVGAGSVLKDIIRSGKMPVIRLTEVFRQAEVSSIVSNAHKINRGEVPDCDSASDFSMAEFMNEKAAADFIADVFMHKCMQEGWESVQVLSPMHKGFCGVQNLNKLLQYKMNPPDGNKGEVNSHGNILRLGDKVMQIRNNYDKDVYNGDIGRITEVGTKLLKVSFTDREEGGVVSYERSEFDQLQLAYAMSVHKSQGSEYPMVILVLVPAHYIMLQRNLLYTAVTRAKKNVLLVGRRNALETAVYNDKTKKRYSLLAERLQENGELH